MFVDIKYFVFDFWFFFFVLFQILIDFLMAVDDLPIFVEFLLEDGYFLVESFPILGEVVGAGYVKGGVLGGGEGRLDFLLVGVDFWKNLFLAMFDAGELLGCEGVGIEGGLEIKNKHFIILR